MKKTSWVLIIMLLINIIAVPISIAEAEWTQSPMLDEAVEKGLLPPVEQRLPLNPASPTDMTEEDLALEVGTYGGTLRMISAQVNWSDDVFIGMTENLLTSRSVISGEFEPNIVESYSIDEENKVFTFNLRKGLKWSDGTEVTMADFEFGINDFVLNEELNPVVAAWMRDGGISTGDPFTFTVIDDDTFSLSFKESYGAFLAHISISGWKGYTDLLKPAHYLKQYHIDYAEECHGSLEAYYEFMTPIAAAIGYDDITAEGNWINVFNQIDCTNWEASDPTDMLTSVTFKGLIADDFPHLYPWCMTSTANNYYYYERNPYYFKVDADGQQLPYLDYIEYKTTETTELLQMAIISGEVDFQRANATVDNISMYLEHSDSANIDAVVADQQNHPTDIAINANYGLNADGTVKDDEASQAWQEVIVYPEFRKALAIAIDAAEISESVYKGFVSPFDIFGCVHDIDGAAALLDEIGVIDTDGDGYRETPSGKKLQFQIWTSNAGTSDYVDVVDLISIYWREVGLNAAANVVESTYLDTATRANEVPARLINVPGMIMWFSQNWGTHCWAPLWEAWYKAGGLAGGLDTSAYLTPPQDVQDFYKNLDSLTKGDSDTAVNITVPKMVDFMVENNYLIMHIDEIKKCIVTNRDLGNVPVGGLCIARGFPLETMYYTVSQD